MLPERKQAVQPDSTGAHLEVREIPLPRLRKGEVLIRMAAAPINPSDLGFLAGAKQRAAAIVPGLEGSGTVVAAGPGLLPRLLVGRRVAFASAAGGTWADYAVSPASRCIPLRRSVSLEQGATLIVNPLTAMAFMDMARRGRHRAVVNNAAASALGRMILRLAHRNGLSVINIVRRQEQADLLKGLGAEHVLVNSDDGFAAALRELGHRLHATLVLDPVAGAEAATLIDAAPFGSTVVVYAGLAGAPGTFNPRTLAGEDKKVVGFYLANWMAQAGLARMVRTTQRVQRLVASDLQTTIQARFPLAQVEAALAAYTTNMTAGKVLLVTPSTSR